MSFDNQNTDGENSRPLHKAKNAGDDLKQTLNKSSQAIAQEKTNLGGYEGDSGKNPGAPVPGGI